MSRIDTIHDKICLEVRSTRSRIKVAPKQGLFNFRCHQNAVQYARENGGGVFEIICIQEEQPILHYLNKKGRTYLETTLGWESQKLEYYLIREIPKENWDDILQEFSRSNQYWLHRFTNFFDRHLLRIERVV